VNSKVPDQRLRRSQLYRIHQKADARFADYDGALCVAEYIGSTNEFERARHLGLADLSTLSRIGFNGRGAPDWLNSQGVQLPERPNQALTRTDGSLLVRLSEFEVLVLPGLHDTSTLVGQLQDSADSAAAQNAWLLPRADSHCWLALTGEFAAQTLAKVCAVDMRLHKFAQGEVAQSSLARVNVIAIRHDLNEDVSCFYILCDVSFTEFLWESLLDAMQEFDGRPVGLLALNQLQRP